MKAPWISTKALFGKDNNLLKKIELSQIRYIQAYKNYLVLQMEREKVIIRFTLSKFYQVLPEVYFHQVHRSYLVNVQHVDSLTSTSLIIGLSSESISKNFKAELTKKLNFFQLLIFVPPFLLFVPHFLSSFFAFLCLCCNHLINDWHEILNYLFLNGVFA